MTVMWGIHNDKPEFDFLGKSFIAVGWDPMPDLTSIGSDKDAMKAAVAERYPAAKPGAIPIWAGILLRFAFEMKPGDLVVYPHKADSTVNVGRVTGEYAWDGTAPGDRHRRTVQWLRTGVPRALLTKSAGYEIGSAVTLFKVKNHSGEFEALIGEDDPTDVPVATVDPPVAPEVAIEGIEDEPNAERIDTYTRDFVVETLWKAISGHEFEHFVAHLLQAMGYRATVTAASGDGGFDIVAHRDPLGLEPPIIKVQCKRTLSTMGRPEVQKLTGALATGGSELGLFVTLGGYSKEALDFARSRQDLRLVSGHDLVGLVLEYYEQFAPEYKRLLPLRRLYVVDRQPEDG